MTNFFNLKRQPVKVKSFNIYENTNHHQTLSHQMVGPRNLRGQLLLTGKHSSLSRRLTIQSAMNDSKFSLPMDKNLGVLKPTFHSDVGALLILDVHCFNVLNVIKDASKINCSSGKKNLKSLQINM